jgi:hypothetical protein
MRDIRTRLTRHGLTARLGCNVNVRKGVVKVSFAGKEKLGTTLRMLWSRSSKRCA